MVLAKQPEEPAAQGGRILVAHNQFIAKCIAFRDLGDSF
jgi:hypothetical protein